MQHIEFNYRKTKRTLLNSNKYYMCNSIYMAEYQADILRRPQYDRGFSVVSLVSAFGGLVLLCFSIDYPIDDRSIANSAYMYR